jgi:hypothetical protein
MWLLSVEVVISLVGFLLWAVIPLSLDKNKVIDLLDTILPFAK